MRVLLSCLALGLLASGCEREERSFRPNPAGTETATQITQTTLAAGPQPVQAQRSALGARYENNAFALSQGKRLFAWFNCSGCHGNGGGGSGPALMDDTWIYGSGIENIVATIREGRPNGMPSFRGRIPDDQIWQIAAYVRALAGLTSKDAAPSRNDDLHPRPSENRLPAATPKAGGTAPPATQMPQ
jgi:cytochrome c oxidase cbb3-type subunit III